MSPDILSDARRIAGVVLRTGVAGGLLSACGPAQSVPRVEPISFSPPGISTPDQRPTATATLVVLTQTPTAIPTTMETATPTATAVPEPTPTPEQSAIKPLEVYSGTLQGGGPIIFFPQEIGKSGKVVAAGFKTDVACVNGTKAILNLESVAVVLYDATGTSFRFQEGKRDPQTGQIAFTTKIEVL